MDPVPSVWRCLTALAGALAFGPLSPAAAGPVAFSTQALTVRKHCRAVAIADLDCNGAPDIVALSGGRPQVLYNTGDGTFRKAVSALGGVASDAPAIEDLNRDHWLDMAVIGRKGVTVVSGSPDGRLRRSNPISLSHSGPGIAAGDIDGDGIPDLVVGRLHIRTVGYYQYRTECHVVAYRGHGDGTFDELDRYGARKYPVALALGDFDRDGVLDLAASDLSDDGAVMVRRGLGGGLFGDNRRYPSPRPDSMIVADLNGDSWPDVAIAGSADSAVGVLYGGPNGFAPAVAYPLAELQGCIASGDIDGDGRLDLVVATGEKTGAVVVLYGQPSDGFGRATACPAAPAPRGVAVADVDGDGRPDIAATSYTSATLLVLHNLGAEP